MTVRLKFLRQLTASSHLFDIQIKVGRQWRRYNGNVIDLGTIVVNVDTETPEGTFPFEANTQGSTFNDGNIALVLWDEDGFSIGTEHSVTARMASHGASNGTSTDASCIITEIASAAMTASVHTADSTMDSRMVTSYALVAAGSYRALCAKPDRCRRVVCGLLPQLRQARRSRMRYTNTDLMNATATNLHT